MKMSRRQHATADKTTKTARARATAPDGHSTNPSSPSATLTARTEKLVESIKGPFTAFVEGFDILNSSRGDLAPRFMKAFDAWQADTKGTFVAFVRVLDPKVPTDRDGYRAHSSYQAADYLRRLLADAESGKDDVSDEDKPVAVYQAFLSFVATVLPSIDPTGALWTRFATEMHWTEERAAQLKKAVEEATPIKLPPTIKHRLSAAA